MANVVPLALMSFIYWPPQSWIVEKQFSNRISSQTNRSSCLESRSLNWRCFERNFSHLQANGFAGEIVYVC